MRAHPQASRPSSADAIRNNPSVAGVVAAELRKHIDRLDRDRGLREELRAASVRLMRRLPYSGSDQ